MYIKILLKGIRDQTFNQYQKQRLSSCENDVKKRYVIAPIILVLHEPED